ncbi:MAG: protein kinase domain-containing protein [Planctomycetota bacterium]|jgi:TolB-like protein/predicted Ser/Thr protein kinase
MVDHEADNDRTQTHIVLTKGTMVQHYRIVEKIGAGGMGEVYLAEDTKLNRQVALKFMPAHLASDDDLRTRFTREAQAAAKLDHPNIIPIHEVGDYQGRPFIAMAHIEGESLRDVIKKGKLSVPESIDLTMQICEGLNEAHDAGVVHRDVKPGNIIIDTKGRARILDFGLATVSGEEKLTKTGSTIGTVGYMAPEQITGTKVDKRADIFSVGVILYEMIAGRRPFTGDNDAAVIKAIIDSTPEPIARFKSGVTGELQRIVNKALAKDPSVRYQSADGVLADLKHLELESSPTKKNRIGLWLAAGIVIAAATYFGLSYLNDDSAVEGPTGRIMLAVLPFENLGAPEDEYFADGITDEITSKVGILDGLGVIARTSILQYKGTTKRISEIGAELNVDYILEGTIRWDKSGDVDKVRITPQLIRVLDETHLWADNLQRDLSEIFEVQEEIAINIAGALNVALLSKEQEALDYRPTDNLDAYDYYLRAKNYTGTDGGLKVIEFLDKAIELDSNFALAFAMKSQAHSSVAFFRESGYSEHTKPARLAYNRAFEIQPDLGEAYIARGSYYNLIERDYDKALKEFELAQQGQVDEASVLMAIAMVKLRQGKWRETINLSEQIIKLDPQTAWPSFPIIQASWYSHQYKTALAALDRMISLDHKSTTAFAYSFKAQIQICAGADIEEIRQTLSDAAAAGHRTKSNAEGVVLFNFPALRDQSPDFDSLISRNLSALSRHPNPDLSIYIGRLYHHKGDTESAYLYFDSALIMIENRYEAARTDTSGRFEEFPVEHKVYENMAEVYSLTNRHEQAIEQAQLAIESMPIEACHW